MGNRSILNQETKSDQSSPDQQALLKCAQAREFIEACQYEEARQMMAGHWERIGIAPEVRHLGAAARAEVLLLAGALSGWIGSSQQIEGAQEIAKNLLSESLRIFNELELLEKVAEAQIDLGICYWRAGDYDTAKLLLDGVLEQMRDVTSEQKARACLNRAVISHTMQRHQEALEYLLQGKPSFDGLSNHGLCGRYHHQLAMAYHNLGTANQRLDYLDIARIEFAGASAHYEQINNRRYEAAVQNNLGDLCIELGRLHEAHLHLERARRIMVSLRDRLHIAVVDETRARLYLAEHHASEAARIARTSMMSLQEGDERAYLVQAQTTYATALARQNQIALALENFDEALQVAEVLEEKAIAATIALTMIEELAAHLNPDRLFELYELVDREGALPSNVSTLRRQQQCARRVLDVCRTELGLDAESAAGDLAAQMKRHERRLIERALAKSGKITAAARLLGLRHQRLSYKISTRHDDLVPQRQRRTSIIPKEKQRNR